MYLLELEQWTPETRHHIFKIMSTSTVKQFGTLSELNNWLKQEMKSDDFWRHVKNYTIKEKEMFEVAKFLRKVIVCEDLHTTKNTVRETRHEYDLNDYIVYHKPCATDMPHVEDEYDEY